MSQYPGASQSPMPPQEPQYSPYQPETPYPGSAGAPYSEAPQYPEANPYPEATQYPGATQYPVAQYPVAYSPYPPGVVESPQAQTILILGILGFFTGGITAFIAWYMGGQVKKEIAAGAPYYWGGNLSTGYTLGKVLSIIVLSFVGLYVLFLVFALILAAFA